MIFDFENRWDTDLSHFGIIPQKLDGVYGILFSPLLHGDIWHLMSNTFPLLILGTALYYFYEKIANKVAIIIYFLSGILVWIGFSPFPYNDFLVRESYHIGASGVVYGIASFLISSGAFRKNKESLAIALAVIFMYGGLLYGIFPTENGTSYEAHFFGALSGFIAAFRYRKIPIWKKQKVVEDTPDYRQAQTIYNNILPGHFQQNTNSVLMIKPLNFGFNSETAGSNSFQKSSFLVSGLDIKKKGIEEFDNFVAKLRNAEINVFAFQDQHNKKLPDAVFPNNWISFHQDGKVILYPMLSKKRREERREDVVDILSHKFKFNITEKIDYSPLENIEKYLEGTGSIVFDHINKLAYGNISTRTDENTFFQYCNKIGYQGISFEATTSTKQEIYHTNVLLSVGEDFAVICSDVIRDKTEKDRILTILQKTKTQIIEISEEQMNNFCANILQLSNNQGQKIIAMSDTAFDNFNEVQLELLKQNGRIVHSNLATIENYGGGSARCMLAEIFLPR